MSKRPIGQGQKSVPKRRRANDVIDLTAFDPSEVVTDIPTAAAGAGAGAVALPLPRRPAAAAAAAAASGAGAVGALVDYKDMPPLERVPASAAAGRAYEDVFGMPRLTRAPAMTRPSAAAMDYRVAARLAAPQALSPNDAKRDEAFLRSVMASGQGSLPGQLQNLVQQYTINAPPFDRNDLQQQARLLDALNSAKNEFKELHEYGTTLLQEFQSKYASTMPDVLIVDVDSLMRSDYALNALGVNPELAGDYLAAKDRYENISQEYIRFQTAATKKLRNSHPNFDLGDACEIATTNVRTGQQLCNQPTFSKWPLDCSDSCYKRNLKHFIEHLPNFIVLYFQRYTIKVPLLEFKFQSTVEATNVSIEPNVTKLAQQYSIRITDNKIDENQRKQALDNIDDLEQAFYVDIQLKEKDVPQQRRAPNNIVPSRFQWMLNNTMIQFPGCQLSYMWVTDQYATMRFTKTTNYIFR